MGIDYRPMYRLGITPWERYGRVAAASFAELFDRERAERPTPPGRALDLGCGRGMLTPELARRGYETVGVDIVPRAIEAARQQGYPNARYEVGDVTALPVTLGTFDLFIDIGCFQGLDPAQRIGEAQGVTRLANPGASMLMLQFGPSAFRRGIGGVSRDDVDSAFAGWTVVDTFPAETAGLGWPMNRTRPQWYRLKLGAD